jgi:ATP-dependent DNA helicase UvrD/PcrA
MAVLEDLWRDFEFQPNAEQEAAIRHAEGPLYLPAGPGSGKTRVLLWRTTNLVVFHGIAPDQIFLSTFTEKAAQQLREGLRTLLAAASNHTGQPYDTSRLYVGTVHALCQRILTDRRFYPSRERGHAPALMDDLDQYLWGKCGSGRWTGSRDRKRRWSSSHSAPRPWRRRVGEQRSS